MHRLRSSNLPLASRLALDFGMVLALTAAIVAYTQVSFGKLEHDYARVAHRDLAKIVAAGEAKAALSDAHFAQAAYVLTHGATKDDYANHLRALDGVIRGRRSVGAPGHVTSSPEPGSGP